MNEERAYLLLASKGVIVREMPGAPVEDRVLFINVDAFKTFFVIRRFEERRRELVDEGWIDATTMDDFIPSGCKFHTLIEVSDLPDDDAMVL